MVLFHYGVYLIFCVLYVWLKIDIQLMEERKEGGRQGGMGEKRDE